MDVSATLIMALPYYVLTIAMWGTAAACAWAVYARYRPGYTLLLGVGCLLLGAGFFLMAATAGPHGHLSRDAVALPIRALNLAAGLLWLAWLAMFARSAVVVRR